MADVTSKMLGSDTSRADVAEIDALAEVIAAAITMAARAGSDAATVLLQRALATLNDRSDAQGLQDPDAPDDGGCRGPFKAL